MAEISASVVKELRDRTNAGMMDCKKALSETGGDIEKAIAWLRQKGLALAAKRAGRTTSEGTIQTYIHSNNKLGVMVEVNSETDFVAKTDQFIQFAKDIAMHIAATNPVCITKEEMPQDILEKEKEIYRNQALESGKPANIVEKMIEGRVEKFYKEACLMEQPFVKDPNLTIKDMLNDLIAKLGESISIRRYVRFQVGN
jgi:elongation factor Ts